MRVLVLANSAHEARRVADLAALANGSWQYVNSARDLLGRRGAPVLATGMDCWRNGRPFQEVQDIGTGLTLGNFKVTRVPCPPEWGPSGYRLPAGWDTPVPYGTFAAVPKVRWWRGWFSWLFRGQ